MEATWRSVSNIMQKVGHNIHHSQQLSHNNSHPNNELIKRIYMKLEVKNYYDTSVFGHPELDYYHNRATHLFNNQPALAVMSTFEWL